ncbi:DUF6600 domain-containing protein [Corallococcus sp. Z5C101001]|uniref:DUF6600 domain-containing protein n=1 Tax=Corallococcus sp. Z5C101001 TaxID=2596829 RepID=UPI00163DE156|nr:DUF6600 domain-containing protein [Corallococcus sp. Z5C101001]
MTSTAAPLGQASSIADFRETLSPYGTWINVPDAGWVWRPNPDIVGANFVPYSTGGQWVSSDWGWTFESQWDWGWAPFHYGRWFISPNVGWVWWPDTEWAPAWVDWRWGGGFVGWQPLGPPGISVGIGLGVGVGIGLGWTFVSAGDFVRPNVGTYRLAPNRVSQVYRQTQPVGERVAARNGHWNRGPAPQQVARATGHPVPQARPMTPPTAHPPRARTGTPVAPSRPVAPAPQRAPAAPREEPAARPTTTVPAAPHEPAAPRTEPAEPHETHEPAPPHEAPSHPEGGHPEGGHPEGGHSGGGSHHGH